MPKSKALKLKIQKFVVTAILVGTANLSFAEDYCMTNPIGSNPASNLVTTYGSSNFTCPASFEQVTVDISAMNSGETVTKEIHVRDYTELNGDESYIIVEVKTTLNTNDSVTFEAPFYGIDVAFTDSARKGNGCLYSYGTDTTSDTIGYSSADDSVFPTKAITYCVDSSQDVLAKPPRDRDQITIASDTPSCNGLHGVNIDCGYVPKGERRTIVVSKDTYKDDDGVYQRVPGYGFSNDDGEMDLSGSVCACYGPTESEGDIAYVPDLEEPANVAPDALKDYEECDPNPDGITSADHEDVGLDSCTISAFSDIPVTITLQNPYCFTLGGTERCF